jgi:hypothetical protein
VLEKGTVVESGSHAELILNNGFYRKIYDIQVSIEDEINTELKSEQALSEKKRKRLITKQLTNVQQERTQSER